MKTTLDVPDELMRRVKKCALQRDQKLKDTIAQLLEAGMAAAPGHPPPARPPRPIRLKKRPLLTIGDIEAAIAAGRDYSLTRFIRSGGPWPSREMR